MIPRLISCPSITKFRPRFGFAPCIPCTVVDRMASSWCFVRRERSLSWEICWRRGGLLRLVGSGVVFRVAVWVRKGKRGRRVGRLAVRRARADSRYVQVRVE